MLRSVCVHLQRALVWISGETWYFGPFSTNCHSRLIARTGKLIKCLLKTSGVGRKFSWGISFSGIWWS